MFEVLYSAYMLLDPCYTSGSAMPEPDIVSHSFTYVTCISHKIGRSDPIIPPLEVLYRLPFHVTMTSHPLIASLPSVGRLKVIEHLIMDRVRVGYICELCLRVTNAVVHENCIQR